MKKLIIALVALFTLTVSANAMSYEQAREQALFLTDKMAYELDLTDEQYEAAYEINLDYLMRVNNYNDLYGSYWDERNYDLQYILYDWQYNNYVDCQYFYRPLYWGDGFWHFRIYARYPHRDYYYFGCPTFYGEYRGSHSWRMNGGRSWYQGREFGSNQNMGGMRERFNQGDYGRGNTFGNARSSRYSDYSTFGHRQSSSPQSNYNYGGNMQNRQNQNYGSRYNDDMQNQNRQNNNNNNFGTRQSSTRETVRRTNTFGNRSNTNTSVPSSTFTPRSGSPAPSHSPSNNRSSENTGGNRSFGNGTSTSGGSHFGHR